MTQLLNAIQNLLDSVSVGLGRPAAGLVAAVLLLAVATAIARARVHLGQSPREGGAQPRRRRNERTFRVPGSLRIRSRIKND